MTNTQKLLLAAGLALAGREAWARLRAENLDGQVALITGGSRGLGLALAREFARQGCRLALCARDPEELQQAQASLADTGAEIFTVPCDVREQESVNDMVAAVTARYGQIDILVNNAGIIQVGPVQNMTASDFADALQSDFWGTLYPVLAVLPQMQQRRAGRIVNVTSIGGKISVPHLLPYSCAKFAATGLSVGLRAELARDGITVTTIAPGLLRTGSFLHALFKGHQGGEYAWFSVSDNLPGGSVPAENAARQVVQATRRGEAERVLGLPFYLAARFAGLFPGLTADLAGWANRILPPPSEDDTATKTGAQVRAQNPSKARDTVTALGFAAAERLNE